MPRVLAVADEVVPALWNGAVRAEQVDLVLAAGDLPFEYLDYLASTLNRPCVFVPGNHDPDLSGFSHSHGMSVRAGLPDTWPGPPGAINADGRIVEAAGLRIAGLGGSARYRDGPNQWTEAQQSWRARRLRWRAALGRLSRPNWPGRLSRHNWPSRGIDVLVTHAPPRRCGDREDLPHRGFECLHDLVAALRPALLVHGHIHPHGQPVPDRLLGHTRVVNAVGYRILELSADPVAIPDRGL
jgi:calcineurin-like phosphoesterase family protein